MADRAWNLFAIFTCRYMIFMGYVLFCRGARRYGREWLPYWQQVERDRRDRHRSKS